MDILSDVAPGAVIRKQANLADFIPASILGLLALILGFTFSMAINRYEYRKELVVKEASAISIVFLRSKLVNWRQSSQIVPILRSYVEARLEFTNAKNDLVLIQQAENKTALIQSLLWDVTIEIARENQGNREALFVQGLNDLITLQKERYLALHNRIPGSVYWSILLIACVGLLTYNFSNGIQGKTRRWAAIMLAFLFGLVFALINDLDRPRAGTISVSQEAMEGLRETLKE